MKANDFEENYLSVVKDLSDHKQQLDKSRNTLKSIHDSLLCLICKGLLADECSVLACCRTLGCCQVCLDEWITHSPTCPHCRSNLESDDVCQKVPQMSSIIATLKAIQEANQVIEL